MEGDVVTQTEIIKKYPELFGEPPFDPKETLIAFGFEVNDGWLPILEKGFGKISEIVKKEGLDDFRIVQVKEKFGGLRVYTNYGTDEIYDIINEMEEEACRTCELCGSPEGKLREEMWLAVRCDKCYEEWRKKTYGN